MQKYTYKEIYDKIKVLKEFFPVTRLVNPKSCSVAEIIEKNNIYSIYYTDRCFDVWHSKRQCANCTSARAAQTNCKHSKCEILDDEIYYITSCPIEIEGEIFVLELLQDVHNDLRDAKPENLKSITTDNIKNINRKMLMDTDTTAYNKLYLSEHLPFILFKSHQTNNGNACMIKIQHFSEVYESFGNTAALGLVCSLYDIIEKSLKDTNYTSIIRYSDDTFVVFNTSLSQAEFKNILDDIKAKTCNSHILFDNTNVPFSIGISFADLCNDNVTDESSLFKNFNTMIKE